MKPYKKDICKQKNKKDKLRHKIGVCETKKKGKTTKTSKRLDKKALFYRIKMLYF
jgi:hypothetical protein